MQIGGMLIAADGQEIKVMMQVDGGVDLRQGKGYVFVDQTQVRGLRDLLTRILAEENTDV